MARSAGPAYRDKSMGMFHIHGIRHGLRGPPGDTYREAWSMMDSKERDKAL